MQYNTTSADNFDPGAFPKVVDELVVLSRSLVHSPVEYKSDMVISYLKDHCLKTEWINFNPKLAGLITSRFFRTSHTESLFESCRGNMTFLRHFEAYVKNVLLQDTNELPPVVTGSHPQ